MELLSFSNSSADEFSLNSLQLETENQPHTDDGWSLKEVKIFEKTFGEYKGITSLAFFEEAARRLPGRDMKSINTHYELLMKDLKTIEDSKVEDRALMEEDRSARVGAPELPVTGEERKKATPWTAEEHRMFLMGLNEYGQGKWKKICKKYVTTRTPVQLASHAQKFNGRRISKTPTEKRRRSINDIRSVSHIPAENVVPANGHVLPLPPPPPPRVFPNNHYYYSVANGSVANGAGESTIFGHQLITQPWINTQYN